MAEPSSISDTVLGTLKRFKSFRLWSGRKSLLGHHDVGVTLNAEDTDRPTDELVAFGREVVPFVEQNDLALRTEVANKLLSVYNQEHKWPEDDPNLAPDAFFQALSLSGIVITVDDNGQLTARISYKCRGLFGEQLPIVHLNREMKLSDVSLE